jgi:hypothetical protein
MSHPSYIRKGLYLENTPGSLGPTVKHGWRYCDGLGSIIMVQYSVGPIIAVIVDKLHWIFVVRADKIKPLFTPKI